MGLSLSAELVELQARARHAADEFLAPRARKADEEARFDRSLAAELGGRGLLDERVSALGLALVYEELGRTDSSAREFATVQVSLARQSPAPSSSALKRRCEPPTKRS